MKVITLTQYEPSKTKQRGGDDLFFAVAVSKLLILLTGWQESKGCVIKTSVKRWVGYYHRMNAAERLLGIHWQHIWIKFNCSTHFTNLIRVVCVIYSKQINLLHIKYWKILIHVQCNKIKSCCLFFVAGQRISLFFSGFGWVAENLVSLHSVSPIKRDDFAFITVPTSWN